MAIKLIASDIDGTIINNEHKITPYTKEVIQSLKDKGIGFTLITGRSFVSAKGIAQQLGIVEEGYGIICLNGLETYYLPNEEPVKLESIQWDEANMISQIGNKFYMGVLYCFPDQIYLQMDEITHRDYKISLTDDRLRYFNDSLNTINIDSIDEIEERIKKEDLQKIVYIQSDSFMDLLHERIGDELPDHYKALMVGKGWLEIMPSHISKGIALENYAAHYNIKPEEIMVFGDAENDISMFELCGNGIAMGNAMESLKEVAKDTTLKNEENGVAHYIEKHILK